jgi:hypothetical protein
MVRETSLETYRTIQENGLLSKRRWQAYDYVFKHGPCTMRQANKAFASQGANSSSIMSRFGELREMGVFRITGTTKDPETGNLMDIYEVVPGALPKKLTKVVKNKCPHCKGTGEMQPCKHGNVGPCASCFHEFP